MVVPKIIFPPLPPSKVFLFQIGILILIAHETTFSKNQCKDGFMAIKVDIE